ncbi:hypothetical protein WISP_39801 [Willisornis vidua]|uniref:Uncharacterized protein n=1 Tax=Willisornis vidua TaxID=1566151 RepID=A0ABQ9DI11_9PASS|nr:hypothetical protein WISP_39801 [Willisornis vidua]
MGNKQEELEVILQQKTMIKSPQRFSFICCDETWDQNGAAALRAVPPHVAKDVLPKSTEFDLKSLRKAPESKCCFENPPLNLPAGISRMVGTQNQDENLVKTPQHPFSAP